MSESKEETKELPLSRSRRDFKNKKSGRFEALQKLKETRESGRKNTIDEIKVENVYDLVEEKEYAKRVRQRREDDWIVDDGNGVYTEDGREIFDEDPDEEPDNHDIHRRNKTNTSSINSSKKEKSKNIKNMFFSNSGAGKRKKCNEKEEEKNALLHDELLGELLSEVAANSQRKSNPFLGLHSPKSVPSSLSLEKKETSNLRSSMFIKKSTGIKRLKIISKEEKEKEEAEKEIKSDEAFEMEESVSEAFQEDFIESEVKVKEENMEEESFNRCNDVKDDDIYSKWNNTTSENTSEKESFGILENESIKNENLESYIYETSSGERALSIYWFDAHEEPFKHPGTVWLFGKFVSRGNYSSVCVTVKNIERRIFLLLRPEATVEDVYNEFDSKIATRFKIHEFKSKATSKNYAFAFTDVPNEAEYLEIIYSSSYPSLPPDLSGVSFSRIFGSHQSFLETLLVSQRIKGPCWLQILNPTIVNFSTSWVKLEVGTESLSFVTPLSNTPSSLPPPPPMTLLSLSIKTVIHPKTSQNEIVMVSGVVRYNFMMERSHEKQKERTQVFVALTRPSDEIWPFDILSALSSSSSSSFFTKMDTERALLAFVFAKIGKIDPDILLGHDIVDFDLEVLLHRAILHKIPHVSRLGRLKRNNVKTGGDKSLFAGRLVCDLKISAKELIKCKSYDLPTLVAKILGEEEFETFESGEIRKAYEASSSLLTVARASLRDASLIYQCICELNALPLALQITQIAGNVLSRTLLGGRSERNEFLLLHAFYERNYICPDKVMGKKRGFPPSTSFETDDTRMEDLSYRGKRRKATYAGGLVLDPKKGFYDKYILLMDFNSLYPSIIQEYNICFTTVNRNLIDDNIIPELPTLKGNDNIGVLPTEIRKLVESRKAVKNLLKDPSISSELRAQYDIRQKALKLTANSMYGCLGFSQSRFYAKALAALITSMGREILLQTRDVVEKMNFDVIYGDTDSLMINSNSTDFDQVMDFGAQIKNAVNKLYRLLELDIDGVYRYMLLLKKKKYAAVSVTKKNNELTYFKEVKGLDIVRRDWSELAAVTGQRILETILTHHDSEDDRISLIQKSLEEVSIKLKEGHFPLSLLSITKTLTKDPTEYSNAKSLPHVLVALRMNSRGDKRKYKAGDTVSYVICEDESNLPATQRAYHIDELKDNTQGLQIDTQYYLSQQLHPVLSRLCDPLEGIDGARIAGFLGLDPNMYRKSKVDSSTVTSGSSSSKANGYDDFVGGGNDERFRGCEPLKFACLCGTELTINGLFSKTDSSKMTLSLLTCTNTNCSFIPLERIDVLKNKITLYIRSWIQRYYASVIICEDPGCSGKTRQLPLSFQSAFPVCSTCSQASMYREYNENSLYHQLLYFHQMFDVSRARLKTEFKNEINGILSKNNDAERNYTLCLEVVNRFLTTNKYSTVNLTSLFKGLYQVTADKLQKKYKCH